MHYHHDPEYAKAREKLTDALNEFVKIANPEAYGIIGATVVYETTTFDEYSEQIYSTSHVILDPGSLAHSVGLLTVARDRLSEYINRTDD